MMWSYQTLQSMLNASPGKYSSSPFLHTWLHIHDYVNKDSQQPTSNLSPQTGQHDPGGIVAFPLTQLTSGHSIPCKTYTTQK